MVSNTILDVLEKLKGELDKLPGVWVAMVETKAVNSLMVHVQSVKILTEKGFYAQVISSTRPCTELRKIYQSQKIDTKKVFILCTVCKPKGVPTKDSEIVIHMKGSQALEQISLTLNTASNTLSDSLNFFFLDSLSNMLVANKPKVFARFIHSVLINLRSKQTSGLIFSVPETVDPKVRSTIAPLCDAIIKL